MEHVHGPNCGCKDYVGVQNANDLIGAVQIDKIRCLNEQQPNSGRNVFKDFDYRFDKEKFIRSDDNDGILLIVPFTAQVKVRSVCVIAGDETHSPNRLRLYVNNENIDFSLTQNEPQQEFPLFPNLDGQIHNAVKVNKFSRVHKLIMHIVNPNVENIEVSYIQIKGQNTNIKRQAVNTVYQVQPSAQKKDIKDLEKNQFRLN